MELELFETKFRHMASFFHKKISEEEVEIWFEKTKYIPESIFSRAISEMMEHSRHFPTPAEFKRAANDLSKSQNQGVEKRAIHCVACASSGFLFAKKDRYSYVFNCNECKQSACKYPMWSNFFYVAGYRIQIQKDYWDKNDEIQQKGIKYLADNAPILYGKLTAKYPE